MERKNAAMVEKRSFLSVGGVLLAALSFAVLLCGCHGHHHHHHPEPPHHHHSAPPAPHPHH